MSNPIIVLGAGRSATVLLDYINELARKEGFRFSLADASEGLLQSKSARLPQADMQVVCGTEIEHFVELIGNHRIVISLLPPPIHPLVGKACLVTHSHLVTASYESPEMRSMAKEIEEKGLIFINECGLDPGIDHMSAMEIIHDIQSRGGVIKKFTSYTGGLVAKEFDDNPFGYKISWNPRNVVLAGKGVAKYLKDSRTRLLPYHRLFAEHDIIQIENWGDFEGYVNRDSMHYISLYGLQGIETLQRGTLRKPGFCSRWNVLVQLGLTDDETQLSFSEGQDYSDLMEVFLTGFKTNPLPLLESLSGSEQITNDILNLGFDPQNSEKLERFQGSPADFLLDLIVKKWVLKPTDKDLVVMIHNFVFTVDGVDYQTISSFGMTGKDSIETAMAKTVGLPLGMVAKQILNERIAQKGLLLPLLEGIYAPVLKELKEFGLQFQTATQPLI